MIPSNHRLAERMLIQFVHSGEWRIDLDGRVWKCRELRRAERKLPSGYLMVRRMLNGKRIVGVAHRLVWQHFNGDIPEGLIINHKNGRKDDNRPCNLEVVTYGQNQSHAQKVLGVNPQQGHHNPSSKLTPEDVAEIRLARQRGERAVDVAARFGIRFQHVYRLWNGERWPHLATP